MIQHTQLLCTVCHEASVSFTAELERSVTPLTPAQLEVELKRKMAEHDAVQALCVAVEAALTRGLKRVSLDSMARVLKVQHAHTAHPRAQCAQFLLIAAIRFAIPPSSFALAIACMRSLVRLRLLTGARACAWIGNAWNQESSAAKHRDHCVEHAP